MPVATVTGLIAEAYGAFADRAAAAKAPGTKQERIRAHILSHAPITFRFPVFREESTSSCNA
jgi:hypothetical protein